MAVSIKPPTKPGGPVRPGQQPVESDADALARAKREKEQLGLEVKELEEELERVKARYDQYFIGFERREPKRERDEVRKRVMLVKDAFTRNAALKFRIQSLHARYLSYDRLWIRSAREKEEGTYRRDIFKARLRAKHGTGPEAAAEAAVPQARAPTAQAPAAQAPAPAARAPVPSAPTAKPAAPAAQDPMIRALFDSFVAAKKQCGEDASNISYDAVARTVQKQVPEIMAKFKARAVDFKVEVKDGRAVLKAIPKV